MRDKPWDSYKKLPWTEIKEHWEQAWDMSKPILLEKSPPNISRAFEIQEVFDPSMFIVMVRDPYAFCEGRRRRYRKSDIKLSAQFWVRCAAFQRHNIEELKNVTHFRYEDIAERPAEIRVRLLEFLPGLKDLDASRSFKARSIQGRGEQKIQNFNQEKIDRLSARDIRDINTVLQQHDQLMGFFGYQYLEPSVGQSIRCLKSAVVANTLVAVGRTKRLGARLRHYR